MDSLQKIIDGFLGRVKNIKIKSFVKQNRSFIGIEPIRVKEHHKRVFYEEFDLHKKTESQINTPIGKVKIQQNHYSKLRDHGDKHRKNFIRYIRPTLVTPNEIRLRVG